MRQQLEITNPISKMIWYTIITTVFLFNYGYVVCAENTLSIRNAFEASLAQYKYICTIYKYNPRTSIKSFMCVGVLAGVRYAITLASCVSMFNDGSEMYIYVNTTIRNEGTRFKVVGITFDPITRGPHTSIAILKIATPLTKGETVGAINFPRADYPSDKNITVISYGFMRSIRKYTLQKTTLRILNVQNPPINSFVASNQLNGVIFLDDADKGAPAVFKKQVIGILSSATGLPDAKATFVNLFSMKNFIVANIRRHLGP